MTSAFLALLAAALAIHWSRKANFLISGGTSRSFYDKWQNVAVSRNVEAGQLDDM